MSATTTFGHYCAWLRIGFRTLVYKYSSYLFTVPLNSLLHLCPCYIHHFLVPVSASFELVSAIAL